MSLFTESSLCLVPSGVKDGKVYSIKPTDGSGDLTFTRSNDTATRVGSDGLIEKVRTNLITYSNEFNNAAWTKSGVTVTGGQADPDGGNNAWKIEIAVGSSNYIYQPLLSSVLRTNSVWMRGDSAVTIGFSAGYTTTNSQALTTSWQRYTFTHSDSAGGLQFDNYYGVSPINEAKTFYVYQAQVESGDIATDYLATTSAAVSVGPVANLPRLDYSGSSCPRLLLEPQRSNLITFSEQLNNAAWAVDNTTVSANAITSPDGYTNADKVVENTANGVHAILSNAFSVTLGVAYTLSCYVKAGERTTVTIASGSGRLNITTTYNLSTGTVTSSSASNSTITSVGNGWYRVTATGTVVSATGVIQPIFYLNTTSAYTGDGTSGAYFWGFQFEEGAHETSYINTLGATVTRGADDAEKTGISSLIGSATGTAFIDIQETNNPSGTTNTDILLLQNNANSALGTYSLFLHGSTGNIRIYFLPENISVTVKGGDNRGQRLKIAFAYSSGDFVCYINGTQVYSASRTLGTGLDKFALNASPNNGLEPVNQALLFKTRLSNSSLAELTSL
jgi:hypothetical protein